MGKYWGFFKKLLNQLPLLLQGKAIFLPFYFKVKVYVQEVMEPVVAL